MKMIKTLGLTLAAASLMTITAQAVQISGGISLSGTYVVDTANLNTADAFTSFSDVIVSSRSLNYITAGVAVGTAVTMNPFTFDPFPGAGITPLWFTAAGPAAGFSLAAPISVDQPGDDTLELKGFGTLTLAGYDPTPGKWTFTANQGAGSFSFSSSNPALPDGGSTLVLLGCALVGLLGLARKSIA